jgi:hypothetical protein
MNRMLALVVCCVAAGCVKTGVHTQEAYLYRCVPPRPTGHYERNPREGIISDSRRGGLINRHRRTVH